MLSKIYTINCKNKTISTLSNNKHYIIGFKHSKIARYAMYSLHPDFKPLLLRDDPQILSDIKSGIELTVDNTATLFIPKFKGHNTDPLNDKAYHINTVSYDDFILYPIIKHLGIIIPYVLLDENEEELTYRSHVVDPLITFSPTNINDLI